MRTRRDPKPPVNPARRKAIAQGMQYACAAGLTTLFLGLQSQKGKASGGVWLRPPGALEEPDFLAACVRCGRCVEDCPWDTLGLAEFLSPLATGTPVFNARKVPCEMCEDIPCVKACPTGALDPELTDINEARMGVAVLTDRENCLNLLGLRCDVCYRVCPLIDEAITLELHRNVRTGKHAIFEPTVHSDVCTGCGKCEHACVLEEAAIKVLPRKSAQGELGAHYRISWEQEDAS
ncbi:MAG: ferredoxin-type protein NapG [Gammaproteobacteria bacterium]|nr:MAG: ferredoxin-type protein NapG [Gammaproteobacteria bacterium]